MKYMIQYTSSGITQIPKAIVTVTRTGTELFAESSLAHCQDHDSDSSTARSFPFLDACCGCGSARLSTKFGELAIAAMDDPNDGRRFVPFSPPGERYTGECDACVGVGGSDVFARLGVVGEVGGGEPAPAAASVRRNSTQRREKDCARRGCRLGGRKRDEKQ